MSSEKQNQWGTPTTPSPVQPRRKRRIFLWVFLAIQVAFLLWAVLGARTGAGSPDDCGTLSREACNDAQNAGTAIGVGIILLLWGLTDFIVAVTYGVYLVATHNRRT